MNPVMNTPVLKKALRGRNPELAAHLGISLNSLSRKINNKQSTFADELMLIAEFLKMDVYAIANRPSRWGEDSH